MSFLDVAVIGAGPYGLSLAAHLRSQKVDFRIFGEPMSAWKRSMPAGMLLKSYPWASNLSCTEPDFTLKRFCTDRGMSYSDTFTPLPLETFVSYGEAFYRRFAPAVEPKVLVSLEPVSDGFRARFEDGELVHARRVVVAVGLSAFRYLPPVARHMPPELVSHSADYGPVDDLGGKQVVIVGSGSSATDLAALLNERGVSVTLVARGGSVPFASPPQPRRLSERAFVPASGIGNGWTLSLCASAPWIVRALPEALRTGLAQAKALGPLGGAFMRDRVVGKVPIRTGRAISGIQLRGGGEQLDLRTAEDRSETLTADHVIFATGYKVNLDRLPFFSPELAARIRRTGGAPALSGHYESSVPGLHFIGPSAANSFGPVCRFVFGARFPAQHLARYLPGVLGRRSGGLPLVTGQAKPVVLQ